MIQIAQRFAGKIAPCPSCSRQPLHIFVRGKELHAIECPPCRTRTARYATAQQAVEAWEAQHTTEFTEARRVA